MPSALRPTPCHRRASTVPARPRRFRRPALLIAGCGDVGLRVARLLRPHWRILALTSSSARHPVLRAAGAVPLAGNLDTPATLRRLAGLAARVLHLAPPPPEGETDMRTRHLLQALSRSAAVRCVVYASTTGVYGDCGGARFDETRPVAPGTPRARRRVDAERAVRAFGRRAGRRASVLRVPGIHAADRDGGPRQRLLRGTPVLRTEDDVYTNHIHADDLARACVLALLRGRAQRVVHVCDDTDLKMGDYFDLAADLHGLPRPQRVTRAQAQALFTPLTMSFLGESRRLLNGRLKVELRLRLRHPGLGLG